MAPKDKPGICFVSPYPPREDGIAEYTHRIVKEMDLPASKVKVVALSDPSAKLRYRKPVIKEIQWDDEQSYVEAAELINKDRSIQVVSLQHVFSLFGGEYGGNVAAFLKHLEKPVVTTLHMVYPNRTAQSQFEVVDADFSTITEQVTKRSKRVIVITQLMADLLMDQYQLKPGKIDIIPHGSPIIKRQDPVKYKTKLGLGKGPIISSFGLIRAKKGLEYAIRAMPRIVEEYPKAKLLLLGESHPNRAPEYYRKLRDEAAKLGLLNRHVFFKNKYLTFREIIDYLLATDIFVTPYLVPEQTSSGAIAYAMGCGKSIVSTPFVYAEESLGDTRGVLVPYRNSRSIARAVNGILKDEGKRERMEKLAYEYAKNSSFELVAHRYLEVLGQAVR